MNTTTQTTTAQYIVTALNSQGGELSTKTISGAYQARMNRCAKLVLAGDALAVYGLLDAFVDDVYGDDSGLYVDLASTDAGDNVIVSLRIALHEKR